MWTDNYGRISSHFCRPKQTAEEKPKKGRQEMGFASEGRLISTHAKVTHLKNTLAFADLLIGFC